MQATGGGHFDYGRAVREQAPMSGHRRTQRPLHRALAALSAGGRQQGVHGAFTAIGHGPQQAFGLWVNGRPALGNRSSHLGRTEALFERIRSNDDFHNEPLGGVVRRQTHYPSG